jgi:EAL domain-containing protein (putative c-di-GMP-specific phosphodiesterase class I)
VIAEGIETFEQQQFLIDMGCDTGQGYLYARAMPARQVIEYLDKHGLEHDQLAMRQA